MFDPDVVPLMLLVVEGANADPVVVPLLLLVVERSVLIRMLFHCHCSWSVRPMLIWTLLR